MQTITRFHLCLFSLNNSTPENHIEYCNKTVLFYDCVEKCKSELATTRLHTDKPIVATISYNVKNKTFITLFGYKNNIFCGIYDINTKEIQFADNTDNFIKWKDYQIARLESLFKASCSLAINGKDYSSEEVKTAWSKAIPLLDKVISYQEKVNRLPEDERNREDTSLRTEEVLNRYVKEYEIEMAINRAVKKENHSEFLVNQAKNRIVNCSLGDLKEAKPKENTPNIKSKHDNMEQER